MRPMEPTSETDTCHWHPDNRAGVRCQRCDRRICALCMNTASVGFHCPECAAPTPRRRTWSGPAPSATGLSTPARGGLDATTAVIGLNLAAFLAMAVAGGTGSSVYRRFASGGGEVTWDYGLLGIGREGFRLVGVAEGDWWRLVTGGFLHAGLLHLVFNMFLLWMLGHQLDRLHGPTRFLGLYLGSLAGGALGVMMMDPTALTVGASGAVFGLMAATVVHQLHRGVNPWASGVAGLVVVNLVLTFGRPGISIGGHLGGLIGGAVLAWVVDACDRRRLPRAVGTTIPYVATLAFLAAAVWAAGRWWDPVLG